MPHQQFFYQKYHVSFTTKLLVILSILIPVLLKASTLPIDCYDHILYLLTTDTTTASVIPATIQNLAYHQHKLLSTSKFFNTKLISNSQLVKQELAYDQTHQEITITTADQVVLNCSYFDRQKKHVLVICPGHSNSKEKMAPFIHMFPDYDLLLVNFRGLGHEPYNFSPIYQVLDFTSAAGFGQKEHVDVTAAVAFLRQQKQRDGTLKYHKVTGLGICLGAHVLARSQALNPTLFDQLILDGCWLSLEQFIDKLAADPQLIFDPQHGGAGKLARQIVAKIKAPVLKILTWGWGVQFDGSSDLRLLLPKIKIPILLFYGKDDKLITRSEFEELWQALNTSTSENPNDHTKRQLFAMITDKPHVYNHLTMPYFYKLACEQFMQDPTNFVHHITDVTALTTILTQNITQQTQIPIDQVFKPKKISGKKSYSLAKISIPVLLSIGAYYWCAR